MRQWFVIVAWISLVAVAAGGELPNIVLILADDMGYGDVHALNERSRIPTPHLDKLAAAGMTFTDAHTPSAVCTPTRYGLLTGRYCWRSRLQRGVLNGYGEPLIERDRPTIASVLRSRGYKTAVVGKWHLGLGFARRDSAAADRGSNPAASIDFSQPLTCSPNDAGFDFSYIIPASLDFPPYVYIENGRVTRLPTLDQPARKFPAFLRRGPRAPDLVMEEVLDHLLDQAQQFIRREAANKSQPFMLYFALTAPHKPVWPHRRFAGTTELGPYGDFVAQVDWTVGQVLATLDEAGIAGQTLVIYTSDNGSYMYRLDDPTARDHVDDPTVQGYRPEHHTANFIYRGTKADIWEAGHRVPLLVRWPGHIKPSSRCEQTVCLTDVMATLAEITGAGLPPEAGPDSFSFWSLLQGRDWPAPRPPVIHHSVGGMFAIRQGPWKLVLGNGSGGREKPRGQPFQKPYQLFDLSADPGERNNVIDQYPEVASRLEAACQRIRRRGSSR